MTVESNHEIAIATLSDWLKRLAPVFQPMISTTKTKAITPTNHNRNKQHYELITIPSNYPQLAQSAGKSHARGAIGFGCTSHWLKNWRESF